MSNEIVKSNQLVVTTSFTPDQVELIKKQIAPKATDNELKLFIYQCERTSLNPFTRQIYCIHRGGKMSVDVSIDGFRLIAQRSGNYAGQDEPEFIYENGLLLCAKIRVYKFNPQTGERYLAAVGVAYWDEYAVNSPMWSKMPRTMLAKCAESQALRKAFPQELSGLYTSEEMEQADREEKTPAPQTPAPQQPAQNTYTITDGDLSYLDRLFENTTLEPESPEYKQIRLHIDNPHMITEDKHRRIKSKLLDSQKDPIHNQSYNQAEITAHIHKIA